MYYAYSSYGILCFGKEYVPCSWYNHISSVRWQWKWFTVVTEMTQDVSLCLIEIYCCLDYYCCPLSETVLLFYYFFTQSNLCAVIVDICFCEWWWFYHNCCVVSLPILNNNSYPCSSVLHHTQKFLLWSWV
jgi:hypothetical protein